MLAVRLGFIVYGAFWGTWAVASLEVQRFLGLSSAGLGALVAVTVIGSLVANPLASAIAARRGVRDALVRSLAPWAAAVVVLAACPWRLVWLVVFLLTLPAGGMLAVAANVGSTAMLVGDPARLLRTHATYNVGIVAGAATAGVALAVFGSWRLAFGLVAVSAVVLVGAIRTGQLDAPDARAGGPSTGGFGELRRSGLLGLTTVLTAGALVEGGVSTFGVLHLRDVVGLTALAGAGAYVAGHVLAYLTRWALSRSRRARGSDVAAARAGLALVTIGLVVEVATRIPFLAAAGLAIASVGVAVYWPMLSAAAGRSAGRAGEAVGALSASGLIGYLAGPPVVGVVSSAAGLNAGVATLAAVAAVAAATPLCRVPRTAATGLVHRDPATYTP